VKEIVIVGANIAGVSAATVLRSEGFEGIVRLVDTEPQLPYERPPLSKGALADQSAAPTPLREESFYRSMSLDLVLGRRVRRLTSDLAVALDDGTRWSADAVVLATGARPRRLSLRGSEDARVVTLRTWKDAARIGASLKSGADIVVVGGGLIGAEVAAAAQARGCRVTWLERGRACLEAPLGRRMAEESVAYHRARGVVVMTSVEIASVESGASLTVRLRDGQRLNADLVVAGIGVEPEVELAFEAGAEVDDGVLVDSAGRTRNPRVFAVGDVARMRGGRRKEHWQNAIEQATNAARAILGHAASPPEVPWFWSDQFDRHIEVAGDLRGAEQEIVRGQPGAGNGSVVALRGGRVVGAATCNRPREARAAMSLIRAGLSVRAEDIADDAMDLRKVPQRGAA
jgi:3-phenylpropionate/trans-cinnamate dioxygenase ferredoxin reductase subunit